MPNYTGTKLDGRYEIKELVGEGGMADVYKVLDLKEERIVAIKILKEEYNDNEELVRRFKNESRAISVLNHPNIVKVFDVSVNDKLQYIIMEFIDGITLKEYIEQRGEPLTYKEVIHFMSQILLALQHAHDKGIVHRDIKPQNIMLVADGTLKMMDFGIARLARSEIHTDGTQAIGSVHYISPEQAQGGKTDARADIYSSGVMMYEMLTARLPFESEDAMEVAIQQISSKAKPLREVNQSVPEGLEEITMKAMAKDPRNRYKSALDMLRDIDDFKKDPSIKFEYEYILGNAPTRYIDKVVNNTKNSGQPTAQAPQQRNKKRRRPVRIVVPIIAVATIFVIAFCALRMWSLFQNSSNPLFSDVGEIKLPNFEGMMLDEARVVLKSPNYSRLRVEDYVTYEYNESYAVGTIISQNPTSNDSQKLVKENQRLYLVVSSAPRQLEIPNIIGMSRSAATKAMLDAGLRPYVKSLENPAVEIGLVYDTDPKVGSTMEITSGSMVTIYVSGKSLAQYSVTVPDILNLTAEEARAMLNERNLKLGVIEEEYNTDYEAGRIFHQSPETGATKRILSLISVRVSLGPEPPPPEPEEPAVVYVTVPNVVGYSHADAASVLYSSGLGVAAGSDYSDVVATGGVISQNYGQGSSVPTGTEVFIVISQGSKPVDPLPAVSSLVVPAA